MPVGRWVKRTAESVVFTDCPPGPEERYYKYIDRFVPIGKTPSATDSANYRYGYRKGISGGGAGLFDDFQVHE